MSAIINDVFRPDEVAMLHEGIVDLAEVSNSLLVPFTAYQLAACRVAWLNVRWFLQRGLDVTSAVERRRAEGWLLAEFGFAIDNGPSTCGERLAKVFHADRYGSSEGTTPHGGSGRSGIAGRFSAKGIGPTPLVGAGATPGHAHGCATLEECLREAVYSEVVGAEFPFGAVPVIAVLDTGLMFSDPDAQDSRRRLTRRGLLIRPTVLRPSHAERAPLFRARVSAGDQGQALQQDDVLRTRTVVRTWLNGNLPKDIVAAPEVWVVRMAQQIAYAQVHRLTNGGVFSSNMSLAGELMDFGNAHALPDWSHANLLDHAAGFGGEMWALRAVVRSIAFYLWKYGSHGDEREKIERSLHAKAEAAYQQAFDRECLGLFGQADDVGASPSLVPALRRYFEDQQRRRVRYQYGRAERQSGAPTSWLGDEAMAYLDPTAQARSDGRVSEPIHRCLQASLSTRPAGADRLKGAYVTAVRRLSRRSSLDRGELIGRLTRLVDEAINSSQPIASPIEAVLDDLIGRSRTHWRHLPEGQVVLRKKALGRSCLLFCQDPASGAQALWLSGVALAERLHWFNTWIPADEQLHTLMRHPEGEWSAWIRVTSLSSWCASETLLAKIARTAPGQVERYASA
ncbi:hypothetical protein ACFPME_12125 [Rhodanobacter umsongensis]|uniref:Uncharacterized protein n=1 Tax=Rhodanobacter umsongensis TaxID=633153 RepID=A0ABW0JMK0_9GAMM